MQFQFWTGELFQKGFLGVVNGLEAEEEMMLEPGQRTHNKDS